MLVVNLLARSLSFIGTILVPIPILCSVLEMLV